MLGQLLPSVRVPSVSRNSRSSCLTASRVLSRMPAPHGPSFAICAVHVGASPSLNGHTASTDSPQSPASPQFVQPDESMHEDVEKVLFSQEQLQQRISEMGKELALTYLNKSPLVLGVLTGAFQFTGDLVRAMDPVPKGITVNFVRASSYGSGTQSSGEVSIKVDINPKSVQGRHVILVEDIVDTGLTLTRLRAHLLKECGAASCVIVTLLDKRERRKVILEPDYTGFVCPNEFVVGYGLDFDEEYRTLPYVGILRPECYAHKLS